MTYAIQAEGLVKRFGKTTALAGVDLAVRPGTVMGLLGPNGAGKTTAVRVLATLLRPDAGRAMVGGFDVVREPDRVRALIGLTGQYAAVDEDLTGFENLVLIGRLLELPRRDAKRRATELLERFELADAARRSVKTYSGGMRRRLDLAASLISRPDILFLDEPTTGLDPRSRGEVWQMVRQLVADGATVLLTTQYLEEADQLANRIALLDNGRVVAEGTPAELKRLVPGGSVRLELGDITELDRAAAALGTGSRDDQGLALQLPSDGGVHSLRALLDRLDAERIEVDGLSVRSADLDDVFLSLTGRTDGHDARVEVTTR